MLPQQTLELHKTLTIMPSRPSKRFVLNWLKALLLSPGMLFPATYLLLYFSTTLYLNTALKSELTATTITTVEQISVQSITTNVALERITLHNVTLTSKAPQAQALRIKKFTILSPKLVPQLFTQQGRSATLNTIRQALVCSEQSAQ